MATYRALHWWGGTRRAESGCPRSVQSASEFPAGTSVHAWQKARAHRARIFYGEISNSRRSCAHVSRTSKTVPKLAGIPTAKRCMKRAVGLLRPLQPTRFRCGMRRAYVAGKTGPPVGLLAAGGSAAVQELAKRAQLSPSPASRLGHGEPSLSLVPAAPKSRHRFFRNRLPPRCRPSPRHLLPANHQAPQR